MKTKFTMIMAVIATFAISLNLHSSNEEVVFGAPAVQMPRGGPKYCAFEAEWENCKMAATGTVCISEDGKCGTGVEVGAPGEGSGEGGPCTATVLHAVRSYLLHTCAMTCFCS